MSSACVQATCDQGLSREMPYGVTPVSRSSDRRAFSSESSLVQVRPVEEVREEEVRRLAREVAQGQRLGRGAPDLDIRDEVALADHVATGTPASVASEISRVTSRMSRFALKIRSWRSEPFRAGEDLADAFELPLGAELARVRLDVAERPPDQLCDRDTVAPAGDEVHHGRLEAVARAEPLVLGDEDAVVARELLSGVVELGVVLDQALHVGGDRDRLLDARDRVHHAHLDRPEARVRAHVPPDVGVVRDAARLLELADDLRVVLVVGEPRRRPGAREGGEDHLAAGREPGGLAAPERGAGREGQELGEVDEQRADHVDRLVRVVHGDVDVAAEDELAAGDVLELVDEVAVAVARGDALPLEEAERVRAGRSHAQVVARGRLGDVRAQPAQLAVDVGRGLADRRRDLEDGLHQLRADVAVELAVLRCSEHGVHVLDEVERLRVEEHVLLLDAERERLARTEAVVEDAAPRRTPCP